MEVIYHRITESLIKAFKFYNCEIEFWQYKNSLFADMCLGRAYNFLKVVCLNLFSWDICYLSYWYCLVVLLLLLFLISVSGFFSFRFQAERLFAWWWNPFSLPASQCVTSSSRPEAYSGGWCQSWEGKWRQLSRIIIIYFKIFLQ